jgi:hypothetical protein
MAYHKAEGKEKERREPSQNAAGKIRIPFLDQMRSTVFSLIPIYSRSAPILKQSHAQFMAVT